MINKYNCKLSGKLIQVMKYGKTVISDPRKPKIMLDVYISSQKDLNNLLNM